MAPSALQGCNIIDAMHAAKSSTSGESATNTVIVVASICLIGNGHYHVVMVY